MTSGTNAVSGIQGEGTLKVKEATLSVVGTGETWQLANLKPEFEGKIAGAGTLKVTKALTWSGTGKMSGSGKTVLGPSSVNTIGSGNTATVAGRTLVNEGTTTQTGSANLHTIEGGVVENLGTYNDNGSTAQVSSEETGSKFVNKGTFQKTEGSIARVPSNFENFGTVNAKSGEIKFEGATHSLILADESVIEGTIFCEKPSVTVNSITAPNVNIKFREETITIPEGKSASLGNLTMEFEGNVTGAGTLTVTKALTWSSQSTMSGTGKTVLGSSSVSTIGPGKVNYTLSGRTLVNEGATSQAKSATLRLIESAVFENLGTYNDNGASAKVSSEGAGSKFLNKGTFQKTEGTETAALPSNFENLGTINAKTGEFKFEGSTHSLILADESVIEGTIFCEKSSVTLNSIAAPNVSIKFREETVTIPEGKATSLGNLTMDFEGNITGAGTLTVTKALTWSSKSTLSVAKSVLGSSSVNTIGESNTNFTVAAHTVVNEGTTTQKGSATLREIEGGVFENVGTYNVNGNSSATQLTSEGTGSKFLNKGTFQRTGGTGKGRVYGNFENIGTINTGSSELELYGIGRSLVFADGSQVEGKLACEQYAVTINSVTAPNADISVREEEVTIPSGKTASLGTFTMKYEGNVTGAGDLEVTKAFNWSGASTMSGAGQTVLGPSTINVLEPGASVATLNGRTLVNKHTFTQNSGRLNLNGGAVFKNQGAYYLSGEPYPTWVQNVMRSEGGGSGKFVNSGRFERTVGTTDVELEPEFENLGYFKGKSSAVKVLHPIVQESSIHSPNPCKQNAGDPIECATGDFSESQTDFAIAGRGLGLVLNRTYSAQAAAKAGSPGAFGYGWSSSYSDRLTSAEEGKTITLTQGDGGIVAFAETGTGSFAPPVWSQDTLTGSAEAGYTLTTPDQTKASFSGSGRLNALTDRNGNETILGYTESGRLETIMDPVGRKLTLTYNGEGLVKEAKDPMGHVVKYAYESKDLKSVTLPGEESPRWEFKYDGSHRITSITDGRGGKTTNEYDGSSRVISQTDPASRTITFKYAPFHTEITHKATGAVTDEWFTSANQPYLITHGYGTAAATTSTFSYNEEGRLLEKVDGNGHATSYTYNEDGDRTSETDAAGNQRKWTYNEAHQVLTETTPEGEKTTIVRDAYGNPETISRPAPEAATQTTTYEIGPYGEIEGISDPLERATSFEYDAKGNLKAAINPEGDQWTWAYDEDSNVVSMVSPRGNEEGAEAAKFKTTIERDSQSRPKEVIDPLEHITKYTYDSNGNLETLTDPKSNTTTYTYSADDELTKVKRPNGDLIETGYDGAGAVTSQTDGNKNVTTYVRNVLEQPTEIIDPLERKTTVEYDAAGYVKSETDPDARKTSYAYDAADRLKEVTYSDGVTPTVKFTYNKDSQVKTMTDGTGESVYTYDQLGRLTEAENGRGDNVGYGYNLADEPIELIYPNGKVVSQEFDEAGRLVKVSDWLGKATTFAYNRDSGLKSTTFPAGTGNVDEYTYDRTDLMSEVKVKKGAETLASLAYTRDKAGLIEKQVSTGLPGAGETAYEYDTNSRLTKAGGSSFEFDAADNLTKAPGTTNAYDKASQLETGTSKTYAFNKEGQRSKLTPSAGPATTYKYDQAGNLKVAERTKEGEVPAIAELFGYDGTGLMASRQVGEATSYLTWGTIGPLPLLLTDGQNSYLYGPGGLPVEHISSGETPTYYHHDQLGSTRMLTNGSGEAIATSTYSPYGTLESRTGSAEAPLGFAGQYTLSQSGLQYLRARMYDPVTGQFLSRDPLEGITAMPYAYATGDPLNLTDPTGLITVGVCTSGAAIFGVAIVGGSFCVQGSSSGEIGVTGTVGPPGIGFGLSGGPGIEVSNADHISELGGPFYHAGLSVADGPGGTAQGFVGDPDSCNHQVKGFYVGAAGGEGFDVIGGLSVTSQASINVPSVISTVVHAVGTAIDSINPF